MANTLTNLIPDLYEALDVVSREMVGFIPSVTLDSGIERAAINQTVRSFVAPSATASDITAAEVSPDDGDQTIGNVSLSITKARRVPFRWNGEETVGINSGPGMQSVKIAQLSQAMRTLTNEIEADLAALHTTTSRAYGTPGVTPFASDLSDSAQILKILKDNGSGDDRQMVISTAAGANMRAMFQLTKANEAADTSLLRQGVLLDIHGFQFRESAQILTPAIGTGATYQVNLGAGYAIGATSIAVDTGSGTVIAGDVVTFAGDTNQYVVATTLAAGVLVLAAPGLRKALVDDTAMTVVALASRNMAFTRSSLILATRMPALPDGGDSAIDRTTITDSRSGISFEVSMYPKYRRMQYEIAAVWGVKNVKPEHTAILLG